MSHGFFDGKKGKKGKREKGKKQGRIIMEMGGLMTSVSRASHSFVNWLEMAR